MSMQLQLPKPKQKMSQQLMEVSLKLMILERKTIQLVRGHFLLVALDYLYHLDLVHMHMPLKLGTNPVLTNNGNTAKHSVVVSITRDSSGQSAGGQMTTFTFTYNPSTGKIS